MTWGDFWRALKGAIGQQPDPARHTERTTADQSNPHQVARSLNDLRETLRGEYDARREYDQRNHDRNYNIARAALIVAAVASLFGALQFGGILYSNYLTRQAVDEMKRNNEANNRDTANLVAAARESAGAAKSAADTAAASLQHQRAWVIPRFEGELTFQLGDTWVSFSNHNYGHSIALDVTTRAALKLFTEEPGALPTLNEDGTRTPIPPNGANSITVGLVVIKTQEQLQNITSGKHKLIVWGDLKYTDKFGTNGQGYFCRMYVPSIRRFGYCPRTRPWGPDWIK